ncbi:hypothetical protein [Halosimplex pelagicum]|uniref:Uncharacterized protein n=1 Tax=Halosimplex pelagicum TaxID=869886 RepID=A0A7D5PCF0_9EURY|nr:hypothetical protein [Halosimplex pelagicum]QLH82298.1 hypothetical protein HZS54_12045 [Halosimplex pelagicum]
MSQSNPESANNGNSGPAVQYDYELSCTGMNRETVLEIEDIVRESGIREDRFAFTHVEESDPTGPLIRIKGLERDVAETVITNLRENGLSEIFNDTLTLVILPPNPE